LALPLGPFLLPLHQLTVIGARRNRDVYPFQIDIKVIIFHIQLQILKVLNVELSYLLKTIPFIGIRIISN
jgi:hypothetical protein